MCDLCGFSFLGFSRLSAKENLQECKIVHRTAEMLGDWLNCFFASSTNRIYVTKCFCGCSWGSERVLVNCVIAEKLLAVRKMVLLLYRRIKPRKTGNLNKKALRNNKKAANLNSACLKNTKLRILFRRELGAKNWHEQAKK